MKATGSRRGTIGSRSCCRAPFAGLLRVAQDRDFAIHLQEGAFLIWFNELLDTPNMGPCMASGVIRKTAKGFEIVHYQLSMAVPNEVAGQVTKLIAEHEKAGQQAGK